MAFPTTNILDNFNRDNEGPPPSGDWKNETSGFCGGLEVVNNQCVIDGLGLGGAAVAIWDDNAIGPDCEAYITIVTRPGNSYNVFVAVRQTTDNMTTADGYSVAIGRDDVDGDKIYIQRIDNGAQNTLGAEIDCVFSDGDKIGIRVIGANPATITAYHDTGGGWIEVGSREDSDYDDAGYLIIASDDADDVIVLDDFGGGDYDSSSSSSESISVSSSSSSESISSSSSSESISSSSSSESISSSSSSESVSSSSSSSSESISISSSSSSSSAMPGTVCWGHTKPAVQEVYARTFAVHWTGTGTIAGVGDNETVFLLSGQFEESESWYVGSFKVQLLEDKYKVGAGTPILKYKTGATRVACEAAGWNNYTVPFQSLGWVKARIEVS